MVHSLDPGKPYFRVLLYALAVHAALFSIFYGPNGTGVLFTVIGGGVICALLRMYDDAHALALFIVQGLYASICAGLFSSSLAPIYYTQAKEDSALRPLDIVIFLLAGLIVGSVTARVRPTTIPTGKWIWIIPVPVLAYSFLHDWLFPCQFCPDAKLVYFYSISDLNGIPRWIASTLSGYSLGMWISGRK